MKLRSRSALALSAALVLSCLCVKTALGEPAIGGIGGPLFRGNVSAAPAKVSSSPSDPTYVSCTKPFGGGQPPATIIAACSSLISANKLAPEYLANVFYYRGNAFFALQDYYTANVDYGSAIGLNPKYAKAYNNRGYAKIKQGNYAAAVPDLNQAISLDPGYLQAYRSRAEAFAKIGEWVRAKADYDQAIALDLKDGETFYNRGVVNYKLGRFADAVADYDRALQLNPNDAAAASNRVIAQQALAKAKQMYADQEADRKAAETAAITNSIVSVMNAYNGAGAQSAAPQAAPHPQQSASKSGDSGGSLPVTAGGAPCITITSSGITPHTPGQNTTSSKPWTRFDFTVENQCSRRVSVDITFGRGSSSFGLDGGATRNWFCTDGYFGNTDCTGGSITWSSHWSG